MSPHFRRRCLATLLVLLAGALALIPLRARAQDDAAVTPPADTTPVDDQDLDPAENTVAGEFTPARGFQLLKTDWGSLNISLYGLVRYVNQLPGEQTFIDHLGREHEVKTRNDINWHRTMIWFSGFALHPRLSYTVTVWSLPTTQQTLAFGNLQFKFNKALTLGAGIGPTLTSRSMQGSHPFWASSDRQMGEEFFRGGFSSAVWLKGEPLSRFFYTVSVNTNLSQLGITASNDSRDLAYSASISWMPTTGEYGLRGGLADFEEHPRVATRFGISAAHAREDRANQLGSPPNETQIRLSDGLLAFEEGALADGVTVQKLNYQVLAFDVGAKYRGFTFQGEYFFRRLSDFLTTGPVPQDSIFDQGFFVQAMYMVVPKYVGVYSTGSLVFDDFDRKPWELSGGVSVFPMAARSWRLNLHFIYVQRSPTGSSFGFYTAGQTGPTISVGTDILL
ncbi:hypothetical protein HJC10_18370 [Corallococcus exiguus]|uniref:hypothetical protein n=1 Tax=Corallococcus TaxID=83461 RepID=UPI000ED1D0B0|nr:MULTISPECIES: hypothetical protein [Corallococcus]NNB88934.1 hypothetical protein [Corallococcus exiguus]NNB96236.1 hypothetical protein [Corallococcus exiguus]NNC04807.1 hypothetical protein [Corallococcus exiguus]NPC46619.1 hypothetical protein [Corallococcus exiguus]RKH85760.1 hypothetical protein D7X99_05000 [Corallococcus sp. AB032C]